MTTYVGLDSIWTESHDSGREFVALNNWSYLPKMNIDGSVDDCYQGLSINGGTALDLSGNGHNLSLSGSSTAPTFVDGESNGYGSWNYDGIDDRSTVSPGVTGVSNNFTYIIWAKPDDTITLHSESNNTTNGTSGQRWLIGASLLGSSGGTESGMGISMGTNGVQVAEHSGSYLPILTKYDNANATSPNRIISNKFNQVAVVTTTSGSTSGNPYHKIYINGQPVKTGVESAKTNVHVSGGPLVGYGSYGQFSGEIGVVKLFTSVLSEDQIRNEFKAYRHRYSI
jgi:hypothetical protein